MNQFVVTSMIADNCSIVAMLKTKGLNMDQPPFSAETMVKVIRHRNLEQTANILAAAAHKTRLRVLICVSDREWSVNELAEYLNVGQSALSQHLSKLRKANLVKTRRARQKIYYYSDSNITTEIIRIFT